MAIQREIDKRTGLKGRASKFMFPVSESKFSGDRVMFKRKAYLKRQQEIHDSFIRKKEARKPVQKRKRRSR